MSLKKATQEFIYLFVPSSSSTNEEFATRERTKNVCALCSAKQTGGCHFPTIFTVSFCSQFNQAWKTDWIDKKGGRTERKGIRREKKSCLPISAAVRYIFYAVKWYILIGSNFCDNKKCISRWKRQISRTASDPSNHTHISHGQGVNLHQRWNFSHQLLHFFSLQIFSPSFTLKTFDSRWLINQSHQFLDHFPRSRIFLFI